MTDAKQKTGSTPFPKPLKKVVDPAKVKAVEEKYTIPAIIKQKFPDLILLVLQTESMNDDERDYWFQIFPIMSEEQIAKFHAILLNEKMQLDRLDQEYRQQVKKMDSEHKPSWKGEEIRKKQETIHAEESKVEAEEKAQEEELLKKLDNNN